MRIFLPAAAACALALAAACGDGGPLSPNEPTAARPSLEIRDTRGGAAPGFYFLPPIAPALTSWPGTFDGSRSPTVEVCRWGGAACVGAPVATFSRAAGTIAVDATNQLYRADWPITNLTPGDPYRVRVLEAGAELGHADARVPGAGETAAGLTAQGIVPLGNGSRLPIRFRLERNTAPAVTITAPAAGTVIVAGTPLTLAATATDAEEGNLASHIVWRSSRLPGELGTGPSITALLPGGKNVVSASVTDANGATSTATVEVVVSVVTIPAALNVPYGGTASLPITIAEPAPAGGMTLAVASSAPGNVGVSTTSVYIPAGSQSANVTLAGVLPGPSTVTVSNPSYGSAESHVATTAALNVAPASATLAAGRTETITISLRSAGAEIAAPAGGVAVSFASTNPGCVTAPAPATIAAGLVSTTATLAYAGTASTPCSATVTASAPATPAITTAAVNVTVNPPPSLSLASVSGARVGSGLRSGRVVVTLAVPAPAGGLAVTLASGNAAALRVAADDPAAAGAPSVVLTVPQGLSQASFYLHGMEGQTGPVPLTASAPGYAPAAATVNVVVPVIDLSGLPATTTTLSPNAGFVVRVGVPNAYYGTVDEQPVRPGGAAITAAVTNGNASVARLVTSTVTGQTAAVTVTVGESRSAATVAAGGVTFDPLGSGTTTVSVTAPGTTPVAAATQTVVVSAPTITLGSTGARVGSGLRAGAYGVMLGAAAGPGGVAVTITSANAAALRVSNADAASVGTPSAVITVPQGQYQGTFYLHGIEGQTGSVTLTATADGYASGSGAVSVVQAVLDLTGVPDATTTLSPDAAFRVRVGVPNAAYGTLDEAPVRPGGATITATVTNGNAAVGRLVAGAGAAQSATVAILPGQSSSPYTVAAGGVAFHPLAAGSTTVAATAPGLVALPAASRTVTVSAPALTMYVSGARVGAGLRSAGTYAVVLGVPAPAGGVAVTLTSADPAVLRVSDAGASSVGSASVTLTVPQGSAQASFHVHGMEGRSGPVALTATAPAFSGATGSMIVVTPTIEVIGVPTTTTTLSADIPFRVHVGLPPAGGSVFDEEPVRPGGTAITATVANTSGLVGQLRTSAGAAQTVTRTIGVGESGTPGTVAAGGLAFDPLGSGTTLVSVSAPGLNAAQGTSVTVSAPALTVYTAGARVGSGLRSAGTYTVQLGAPAPAGGLAVTLASSNGAVLRVSDAGATSVGAASAVLTVPQGQTQASFYIHGVEGQTGSATVTASAPGFTNGTGSVTVLPPSIDISGLATSTHVTSADEPFQVRVGVPNQYNGTLDEQPVRPGSAPIVATVTNAGATVARLVTGALAGQAVTVAIPAGQTRSAATVAAGGVAFHPLAAGSTTVSASAPGAIAHPGATVPVTVIP